MEADIASQAVGLGTNTDFSLMSLFLRADIIVKSVIVILIACHKTKTKFLKMIKIASKASRAAADQAKGDASAKAGDKLEEEAKELQKLAKNGQEKTAASAKTVAEQKAHIQKLSSTLGDSTTNLEAMESQSVYFKNCAARDGLFLDSILEPADGTESIIGDADLLAKLRKAREEFEANYSKKDFRQTKRKRCEELDAEFETQLEKRNKRAEEKKAAAAAAAAQ